MTLYEIKYKNAIQSFRSIFLDNSILKCIIFDPKCPNVYNFKEVMKCFSDFN